VFLCVCECVYVYIYILSLITKSQLATKSIYDRFYSPTTIENRLISQKSARNQILFKRSIVVCQTNIELTLEMFSQVCVCVCGWMGVSKKS